MKEFLKNIIGEKAKIFVREKKGRHSDRKLVKKISQHLLESKGNEPYYHDFDQFISRYGTVDHLVQSLRGTEQTMPVTEESFVAETTRQFVRFKPDYKNKPAMIAQIKTAFGEVHRMATEAMPEVDPYGEQAATGLLIRQGQEAQQAKAEIISSQIDALGVKMERLSTMIQANISSPAIENCTEKIAAFQEKIKEIEAQYQSKYLFSQALEQYGQLLENMHIELQGQPPQQVAELNCLLFCNMALCRSNLGKTEEALKTLGAIPKNVKQGSEKYHYIYAVVIIQGGVSNLYPQAEEALKRALTLRPEYHAAFTLRQYLYTLTSDREYEELISELDERFLPILDKLTNDQLANYYADRGQISSTFGFADAARADFDKAVENGYDDFTARFNALGAVYAQAVKDVPTGVRLFAPKMDYVAIGQVRDGMWEILQDPRLELEHHIDIREKALALYLSCCVTLAVPHGLSVEEHLLLLKDPEMKRLLIMGAGTAVSKDILELLDEDDQVCIDIRDRMADEAEACRAELEALLSDRGATLSTSLVNLLLQLCLHLEDSQAYWQYRDHPNAKPLGREPLLFMDAQAYGLDGNPLKAKELLDTLVQETDDYILLRNALVLYQRNGFDAECETLLFQMREWQRAGKLFIQDENGFLSFGTEYLISRKRDSAVEFFDLAPEEQVTAECYAQVGARLFSQVNDARRLHEVLTRLPADYQNTFNLAMCERLLFQYGDAIEHLQALYDTTEVEQKKVLLCQHLSELYLLKGDNEQSFHWAETAHKLTLDRPAERSHQVLLGRAMRCGHLEILGELTEYQNRHPKVVDWIKAVKIDFNPPAGGKSVFKQLEEALPEGFQAAQEQMDDVVRVYRTGIMPLHVFYHSVHHDSWMRLLRFAQEHKIYLSWGNSARQAQETSWLDKAVTVDALTLMLLFHCGGCKALELFDEVHINYSTVLSLQGSFMDFEAATLAGNILHWLQTAPNVVFEPDGFPTDSKNLAEFFPTDFVNSCRLAEENDIPLLYADAVVLRAQSVIISDKIRLVGLPALCDFMEKAEPVLAQRMRFQMLQVGGFISFNANTILQHIEDLNYQITEKSMAPLLVCRSDFDTISFAAVHIQTLAQLKEQNEVAAQAFAEIIISNAAKVWRRSLYARITAENFQDINCLDQVKQLAIYAGLVLRYVSEIMPDLPQSTKSKAKSVWNEILNYLQLE